MPSQMRGEGVGAPWVCKNTYSRRLLLIVYPNWNFFPIHGQIVQKFIEISVCKNIPFLLGEQILGKRMGHPCWDIFAGTCLKLPTP